MKFNREQYRTSSSAAPIYKSISRDCKLSPVKLINRPVIVKKVDRNHPAFGPQGYGLFAATKIYPKEFIIDYIGYIHTESESDHTSDYDIHFIDNLSIDAKTIGNQGRFINDYRGISVRPNCIFKEYFDGKHLRLGVFAANVTISKGQELMVTYGKGFWQHRNAVISDTI